MSTEIGDFCKNFEGKIPGIEKFMVGTTYSGRGWRFL